jgi:DNA-binding transcriptional MerR regulator
MQQLTLKDLAKRYSVPYSTLAGWFERELIQAHARTGRPGSAIILNEKNVKELENLIRLRKSGLSLQRARHLIEDLRAAGYNPLSSGIFVVIDRRKRRVLKISENKRVAREVAGPHKQQTVMVELILEPDSGTDRNANRAD